MKNKKVVIERVLRSKSPNIIWPLISTAAGLAKWLADEVTIDGDTMTVTWGDVFGQHETRRALVVDMVEHEYARFRWYGEAHERTYWELRMEKSDLTGDYVLIITDFAIDGDADTIEDIWEANLEALRRSTGL